ncbi:MAG: hypothetical protein KJ600_01270 [Nanoarchaeota archaeon]|nr:hypothetical protein [Nanoarchaeota archaeon]MBU1103173.1 hypothetical protein [Nanoarchaeota archaeon]
MKPKDFFNLFAAGRGLYKAPAIIAVSLSFWIFLFLLSKLGERIAPSLQTTFANIAWTVFAGLVSLVAASYFFAGLIGMSKGKVKFGEFGKHANKFWFGNFQVILLIILASAIVRLAAHFGALFIGRALGLEVDAALFVFMIIYLAGLVGVLIFLTFSSFFLVVEDLKVRESIRKSIKFVRKNYWETLVLSFALFVLGFLVGRIPGFAGEVLEYALVVPFVVLVLTRFVLLRK